MHGGLSWRAYSTRVTVRFSTAVKLGERTCDVRHVGAPWLQVDAQRVPRTPLNKEPLTIEVVNTPGGCAERPLSFTGAHGGGE